MGGSFPAASAFFFETDGMWFIITNWHVVSGRHFLNRQPLGDPFFEPFSLTAKLSSYAVGDRERGSLESRHITYRSIAESSRYGLNIRNSVHSVMWW